MRLSGTVMLNSYTEMKAMDDGRAKSLLLLRNFQQYIIFTKNVTHFSFIFISTSYRENDDVSASQILPGVHGIQLSSYLLHFIFGLQSSWLCRNRSSRDMTGIHLSELYSYPTKSICSDVRNKPATFETFYIQPPYKRDDNRQRQEVNQTYKFFLQTFSNFEKNC